jgi:acetyl esterase/lipase
MAAMRRRATCLFCLTIAALGGGCTKFQVLDALVPHGGRHALDVAYGDSPRQRLDVYQPAPTKRPAPVVVFFYGGDWRTGSKSDYRFVAQAFASHGYVVVIPDYRLHPDVTFPGFVEDAASAVRWTRDHAKEYGGDPQRLFLAGHSAGSHLAAMLTLNPTYLEAVGLSRDAIRATAGLSGPYNFKLRDQDAPVFGLASATQPAPQIQPITFVDPAAPPMLLVQGAKDTVVDPQNADLLEAAIRDVGGRVEKISYSKQGHASVALSLAWGFRWLAPTLGDTLAFFARNDTIE